MDHNIEYMKHAINISKLGASMTHPNPMVGAVIVKNKRIIGEGWHHGPGMPHAEVEALKDCKEDPSGATMYVSLEPCNHWGKTPPCTEAIIKAQIAEVKLAIRDANCQVCGGGIEKLKLAGIQVTEGLCREEALEINRSFFYHCKTGRPWVIMKTATSLDGKITSANGESQWITGEKARKIVHELRSQVGAVLIGSGTCQKDDPQLTNRIVEPVNRQPYKVVLDSALKISLQSKILSYDPDKLWVFCTDRADSLREEALQALGVQVIHQPGLGRVDLHQALNFLGSRGIRSVLVEGGAEIFAGFLQADLVNEYYLFYAPFFIGGVTAKGVIGGAGINALQDAQRFTIKSLDQVGEDVLVHAYRKDWLYCLQV
jgi:diaminohydroxyphosphoribosylaminopyrimidine deaminase / 5-amino-6-(5-phosphoribosylamino)uracil reductase